MDQVRKIFMIVVAAIVVVAFCAGIIMAGYYTLWIDGAPQPDRMPDVVSDFLSTVNGVLAANLGAILGISISLRGWRNPEQLSDALQWIAAGFYVVGIVAATILWGMAGFSEEQGTVVTTLPELTRNGIGIMIAVLAAVLGVQTGISRQRANAASGS